MIDPVYPRNLILNPIFHPGVFFQTQYNSSGTQFHPGVRQTCPLLHKQNNAKARKVSISNLELYDDQK